MKKIVFLIIATVLVLGLVLPGCGDDNGVVFDDYITIGVAGPLSFIQGRDHLAGAQMARDEINDAGGVTVGSLVYGIALEEIETNEILDTSGADGTTALTAAIDGVDFVVGGFRTEAVIVYREVAMTAEKIFIDCGAATNALQESVFEDYDTYKYWFKGTPFNSTFLFYNTLKQTMAINAQLRAAAGMGGGDPATTIGIIVEDAEWTGAFDTALPYYLGVVYGFNVTGSVQKPASDATSLTSELTAIKTAAGGDGPMMIVHVLSGPPGKAYGMQQHDILPYTFSTGINVESQDIDYHHDTGAEYHCTMDTWAVDVELTPYTSDFWDDYMDMTGRYPTYCAATYDAINTLKLAIEAEGLVTDDIITWLENQDNAYTGTASTTTYYPMPGVAVNATFGFFTPDQAYALYPHLPTYYGFNNYAEMAGNWSSMGLYAQWTTAGGLLPHDTVYGPGWQAGQAVQWQPVDPAHPELEWQKVGWWPFVATATGANTPAEDLSPGDMATLKALGLCDQWGNWNYAYTGSVPLVVPADWIAYWQ